MSKTHIFKGYIRIDDTDFEIQLTKRKKYNWGDDYITLIYEISRAINDCELSKHHPDEEDSNFDYMGGLSINKECFVCMYISDKKMSLEDVKHKHLMKTLGYELDIYGENIGYSEWTITGFNLMNFTLGNHDLEEIFINNEGKYVHFIIKVKNNIQMEDE